jgi:hypothetical protein
MTKSTNNPKHFGAKEMFRQSIVYLYNSYREDGLNAKKAKEAVAEEVEAIYHEYVESGAMPPMKSLGIADPIRTIDETLEEVRKIKNVRMHMSEQVPFRFRTDTIIRNLQHLKNVLK